MSQPQFFPTPTIDRPLIAYAFLAQTTHATGDLLSGLAPIFKPIASKHTGEVFKPLEFSSMVRSLYGIEIHPWAVEDLAPRLEKAGLLTKSAISGAPFVYHYADINAEFNDVAESEIRRVIDDFIGFAKPIIIRHGLPFDANALEKAFLDQLVAMDFQSILLKPEAKAFEPSDAPIQRLGLPQKPDRVAWQLEIDAKSKIDVLCASFIVHLYANDRQVFELLTRISAGALVAETVLNFQSPGGNATLAGLKVVLDAPFVMALLDLSVEESTAYATKICEQLMKSGASLHIFRHSVDEITSNLRGTIAATDNGEGRGATARRMSKQSFNQYVRSVVQNVESAIQRLKYAVIEVPNTLSSFQYFSEGDEDKLESSIGHYENALARRRDADSIAAIMRLRQGKAAKMAVFHRANYIFVTANSRLVGKADQCTVTLKQRSSNEVPPALTDKYLAGLLFVMFGGVASELTHCRLLANCAAALEPRSDVMRRMHQFLGELDPTKAAHFRALMTDDRASQHMMQLTLGDAAWLRTTDDAVEILAQMEATLLEKHQTKVDGEMQAAREQHERELAEQRDVVNATRAKLLDADAKTLRLSLRLKEEEGKSSQLAENLRLKRADSDGAKLQEVLVCVRAGLRAAERRRSIITASVVLLTVITTVVSWALSNVILGTIVFACINGALTFVGFWKTPDKLFGSMVTRRRDEVFKSAALERKVFDDLKQFKINWDIPEVVYESNAPT